MFFDYTEKFHKQNLNKYNIKEKHGGEHAYW